MFANLAEKITEKLKKENAITNKQYGMCKYGIQQGATMMLNAVTIISIGVILNEIWQAVLFMLFYVPLRSNAGGYHAKTALRCYFYSIVIMIAVLLAIKYLILSNFICIIMLIFSSGVILILSPVEDKNKLLDDVECIVYRKRTLIITILEILVSLMCLIFELDKVSLCIVWVLNIMAFVLLIGKIKNGIKINQ